MRSKIWFLFKLGIFALAFLVGVTFLIRFDEYAGEIRKTLLTTGKFELLIYFVIFALAVAYVVKWLVQKEFHELFVKPENPPRRRLR